MKAVSAEDTNKHLAKVEGVIGKAKEILGRHGYPDNLRTVIVAGAIDQMAILLSFDRLLSRKRLGGDFR